MGHSVSDAAARSVKKGEKVKTADRTPEQIIADIRKNLGANLAVTPDDQRFLLAKYDEGRGELIALSINTETKIAEMKQASLEAMQDANNLIDRLKAQVEEFRTVYEAENRSQSLVVERVEGGGEVSGQILTEVGTVAGSEVA